MSKPTTIDIMTVNIDWLRAMAEAGYLPLSVYLAECRRRGLKVAS